jgi:hypothetical protein
VITVKYKEEEVTPPPEAKEEEAHRAKLEEEERLLGRLQEGFGMVKYAKGSLRPKGKRVFADKELKKLAWQEGEGACKDLVLREMVSVVLGRNS